MATPEEAGIRKGFKSDVIVSGTNGVEVLVKGLDAGTLA